MASSCSFGDILRCSYLIAASSQQMKSALIHIVLNIFLVDDDILLIENALVAANETIDLDVIAQQAIYDVMAT